MANPVLNCRLSDCSGMHSHYCCLELLHTFLTTIISFHDDGIKQCGFCQRIYIFTAKNSPNNFPVTTLHFKSLIGQTHPSCRKLTFSCYSDKSFTLPGLLSFDLSGKLSAVLHLQTQLDSPIDRKPFAVPA